MKKRVLFFIVIAITLCVGCRHSEYLEFKSLILNNLNDKPPKEGLLSPRKALDICAKKLVADDWISTLLQTYNYKYTIRDFELDQVVFVENFVDDFNEKSKYYHVDYYIAIGNFKGTRYNAFTIRISAVTGQHLAICTHRKNNCFISHKKEEVESFYKTNEFKELYGNIINIKAIYMHSNVNISYATDWLWCIQTEDKDVLFLVYPSSVEKDVRSMNVEIKFNTLLKAPHRDSRLYKITDKDQINYILNKDYRSTTEPIKKFNLLKVNK